MTGVLPAACVLAAVALRSLAHAYQPHRLDAEGDQHLDPAYGRSSLLAKHVLSSLLIAAMGYLWWRHGGLERSLPNAHEMLGLALAIAGTGLRARSIAELGRFFTFELGLRSDHALVERGPYRWLMHPAYSGTLLLEAGMVIAFGAWLVGLPLVAGAVIFLLRRMRDEEAALRARFGASFEAYAASRWRLVPGVY